MTSEFGQIWEKERKSELKSQKKKTKNVEKKRTIHIWSQLRIVFYVIIIGWIPF